MLGKYDEFGEYLDSDTSKKMLESFFGRILCLKMPVHASDIFYLTNANRTFLLLHYKNKFYFYIFTFQVKRVNLNLDIFKVQGYPQRMRLQRRL